MEQRIEQILVWLAQQYAPQALQSWDRNADINTRIARLARLLANYNILVLLGEQPYLLQNIGSSASDQLQQWVNGYGDFYNLLARALFPSYTHLSAHYTDDRWPMIIYLQGAATPVIQCLAGFVAPFVVHRQLETTVSEVELVGLMDLVLEDLEANNLPREAYRQLRNEGVKILRQLLEAPIRQLPLAEFDRPIFSDSQRFVPIREPRLALADSQPTRPDLRALPPEQMAYGNGGGSRTPHRDDTASLSPTQSVPPPDKLPEEPPQVEAKRSAPPSHPSLRRDRDGGKKRRAPLPPLPNKKTD